MRIEERDDNLIVSDFDEFEAYKIACEIEQDGLDFYKKLSEKVTQENAKKALDFLVKQ